VTNPRAGIPNRSHKAIRPSEDIKWMQQAACYGMPDDVFFPKHAAHIEPMAKRICGACDVRKECLEYALRHGEWAGVWGGKSVQQRRDIARKLGIRSYRV
jgi:WhiB family redox-sensing transcriptional regulator